MTPASLAAALARPRKLLPNPPEPEEWLESAGERIAIHTLGRPEAATRALFVHGWETDHRDLARIAGTLAGNGAYCVAPDLPAHGTSSGASMTIPEAARALQAVHRAYGPFELAVGYSMGAAILLYAMAKGMPAGKAALVAPPGNYVHELSKSARAAGAPEALIAPALDEFRLRCPDLDELDSMRLAPSLSCPGIVAVAGNDGVLDPQDGRNLVKLWRGSRLLEREQASHRSILRDPAVAEAIAGLL
jgi:pimeloyl-ACP methyl ester carboxylesterase